MTKKLIDDLIANLQSSDSATRNKAALALMDLGDDAALAPLIQAICVPENIDHRGTLVHALTAFDCIDHLEFLIDLCVRGNYEVSCHAYNCIDDLEFSPQLGERIKKALEKYASPDLPHEHSAEAFEAVFQLASASE